MMQNAIGVQLQNQVAKILDLKTNKQQLEEKCEGLAQQLQEVREEQAAIKENIKKKEMEDQK
jgi:hypothetical protein